MYLSLPSAISVLEIRSVIARTAATQYAICAVSWLRRSLARLLAIYASSGSIRELALSTGRFCCMMLLTRTSQVKYIYSELLIYIR